MLIVNIVMAAMVVIDLVQGRVLTAAVIGMAGAAAALLVMLATPQIVVRRAVVMVVVFIHMIVTMVTIIIVIVFAGDPHADRLGSIAQPL